MARHRRIFVLLHALFLFSGVCGLGYQLVWTRLFGLGLGQEMPAVLAVVAAFFGGFALGAWALDRHVSGSRNPGRWYAVLEAVIGVWALVTVVLVPWANDLATRGIGLTPAPGRHWCVAFVIPLLALLPATAAMGATLPAMERFARDYSADGRCVGSLYAANTLGAAVGVGLGAFLLVPAIGFAGTLAALAVLNLFCAAGALALARPMPAGSAPTTTPLLSPASDPEPPSAGDRPLSAFRRHGTLVLTGLLGIGFEVLGLRLLNQVLANTVFTFASVLAVFLVGTAAGAALERRFAAGRSATDRLAGLLAGLAWSVALGAFGLVLAPVATDWTHRVFGDAPLGGGLLTALLAAGMVFGLPTLLMGATFSLLAQECCRAPRPGGTAATGDCEPGMTKVRLVAETESTPDRDSGIEVPTEGHDSPRGGFRRATAPGSPRTGSGVGRALALNTVGGALAPALVGLGLLPAVGGYFSLFALATGYLLLVPRWTTRSSWVALMVLGMFLAAPRDLNLLRLLPGETARWLKEGAAETVAVLETRDGQRALRVNNRFTMGGTASAAAEARHVHLPLLLHPAPRRALFLGVGTGISFGAMTLYPDLVADGVELSPEIADALPEFAPANALAKWPGRLRVQVADARRFVRCATGRYDVIIADLFHPARDGAGSLYTREHFTAVRERLEPDGLFCQWLPLYQLDARSFRMIVRTFGEVFPESQAWLLRPNVDTPVIGLVGRRMPRRYPPDWLEQRLREPRLRAALGPLGLTDSLPLFGLVVAGPDVLRRFSEGAPLSTDDRPLVMFTAPAIDSLHRAPFETLFQLLLARGDPFPSVIAEGGAAAEFLPRLRAFGAARDAYLDGLRLEALHREDEAVSRFVDSVRLSADFTLGYAQCVTRATVLASSRRREAEDLLKRLEAARPERTLARDLRRRLFSEPVVPAQK